MAAFHSVNGPEEVALKTEDIPRPPYRSYKKKFLKFRHNFREAMRESNTLYEGEIRANQVARRLREQNEYMKLEGCTVHTLTIAVSQLLELLLDVNDSSKIPPHLHYDLRTPSPDEASVPDLTPDRTPPSNEELQQAQAVLQEARMELQAGLIDSQNYQETENALSAIINQGRSLTNLSRTTHSTLESVPPDLMPAELQGDNPTGFLSSAHEDEYLASLDAYLDGDYLDDQPLPPRIRPNDRQREKDLQLHNPVSVHNWLAHHKPNVLNDEDVSNDKAPKIQRKSSPKQSATGAGPPRSHTKREKAGALLPKADEEVLDEDGSVVGGFIEDVAASQKKRKRGQDDDAYRPKGGGSKKRKRASTKNSNTPGGETSLKNIDAETAMEEM